MIAKPLTRTGVCVLLGCLALQAGCRESAERKAAKIALAAERNAAVQLEQLPIALGSQTLSPETRDRQVAEALAGAVNTLRAALDQAPDYWQLRSHLGATLLREADYAALRTVEYLVEARRELDSATLAFHDYQRQDSALRNWEQHKANWTAVRDGLVKDRQAIEAELKSVLAKAAEHQAAHDDLAKQAQAKRDQAKAAKDAAATMRAAAESNPEKLAELARALLKGREAEKLSNEAMQLESQAAFFVNNAARQGLGDLTAAPPDEALAKLKAVPDAKAREEVKAAAIRGRLLAYATLEADCDKQIAAAEPRIALLTKGDDATRQKSLDAAAADGKRHLARAADLLNSAFMKAEASKQAYDKAVNELEAALAAADRAVDRDEPPTLLAATHVRVSLASAQAAKGKLLIALADDADLFAQVRPLSDAMSWREGETKVTLADGVNEAEERAAGQSSLSAALATLMIPEGDVRTLESASGVETIRDDKLWTRVLNGQAAMLKDLGARPPDKSPGSSSGGSSDPAGEPAPLTSP